LSESVAALMIATMAFMLSAVFRNSSLAVGFSIFLLVAGTTATAFIAAKFDWAKYILFANVNLLQYVEGTPLVEGMTMTFSVVMLAVYFVVFLLLAFGIFMKRDIAN
ncbi:ABC transporter permease, partial [Bacillus inaquosorum]|nr:ABC transporter permease [Bacillus inaquosorum]